MPGTSATLDNEWLLLLAACSASPQQEKIERIRALLQSPIRWKSLFALADRHGAQSLLHQALSGLDDTIPADELRTLKQHYQTNLIKTLLVSHELIRLVDRLSALGIEVMPYKGPALAEVLYGDVAMRQSGDIDLLIRPQDFPRVRNAASELGYTPHLALSEKEERAYLKSGYECAFDGAAGPNLLEVQWAIQPRFYAVDLDMDALFQRGMIVSVAGQQMKTPCSEDLFLILAVHAAKHVWGRLVWLCDLARLMNFTGLKWEAVGSQAKKLGVARILRVTVHLANRLLGATIPAAVNENLLSDAETTPLAEEIQKYIGSDMEYDVESFSYFRLMLRLRERRADQLRFIRRLALTPGPSEWKAVRLPAPLFPLYRVVRLSRLAARLVYRS
jgi:hypothetical protein